MTIARLQKACDRLEATRVGYDQSQRWSFFDRTTRTLRPGGECDCSSGCGAIVALAGYPVGLADPFYTGNFRERLVASGFFTAIKFKSLSQVRAGDFVVGPGHVIFARSAKRWWSAEADERGKPAGGKAGDQTGREARFRAPYLRPGGWSYIVRLISPKVFLRRAIGRHAAGYSTAQAMLQLSIRAPWDGPRWSWFIDQLRRLDRGVPLLFAASADPAQDRPGHAFVVLGSALDAQARPTPKFRARLKLAAEAACLNPRSRVLVTGGAPQAGETEAEVGRTWLIGLGVEPERILIEERSSSTVGNARYSVPLMRQSGITRYTLVSHASHLRRALMLFLARQVQIETAENRVLDLAILRPLAVDDYSPKPVKPALTIEPDARAQIGAEVLALLDLAGS